MSNQVKKEIKRKTTAYRQIEEMYVFIRKELQH